MAAPSAIIGNILQAARSPKNVFIIGSGNVAKFCLSSLVTASLGVGNSLNVTLYNPNQAHAEGIILDVESSSAHRLSNPTKYPHETLTFSATNDLAKMCGAHLIIIVAGKFPSQEELEAARKKGIDREIQAITNYSDMATFAEAVKQYSSNAFVLIVTNPVDYFTKKFQQLANHDPQRIMGFGGALDSIRFARCLKLKLALEEEINMQSFTGYMVSYHNQSMFLLSDSVTINGLSVDEFTASQEGLLSKQKLEAHIQTAIEETRSYGATVSRLNKGGAGAAIAAGNLLAEFICSYCFERQLPLRAPFTMFIPEDSEAGKFYGIKNSYFSLPVIVANGEIMVLCENKFNGLEETLRDSSIRNFYGTVLRLDTIIQLERLPMAPMLSGKDDFSATLIPHYDQKINKENLEPIPAQHLVAAGPTLAPSSFVNVIPNTK